ncbi:hypothetical protein M378DRAFT_115409 [Amanita muscaria Koide BX008]|uniref:Protein kinase domain-containing protein n=1 Tax=Amanita muscaria (strain Koide BX008) TaxID=946122 RepID=A0A0C2XRF9_AMAMK|nr:hypothetical protein M378DRAFT_115409 [Amanita muscaria Koide BX008]
MRQRHTPTLYPLSEQDHPNDDEDPGIWDVKYPSPPQIPSTSSNRPSRRSVRSASHTGSPNDSRTTKNSDIYARFLKKYRSGNSQDDPRNDPDNHYFQRGLGQLIDAGDNSDEEEDLGRISYAHDGSIDHISALLFESETSALPASQTDKERLEWQTMFASVMGGDVLKSEKTRIAVALESLGVEQTNLHVNIWLGLRAKLHGRSEREERDKVEEKRIRIVNAALEDFLTFRVSDVIHDNYEAVIQRVTDLLRQLDLAQSLYPSLKAFCKEKPIATSEAYHQRWDAVNTWMNMLYTLELQIGLLQRWTGSETLDVTQRISRDAGFRSSRKENGINASDGISFVERVLKEDSLQRTFEKGFLVTVHAFVAHAREEQWKYAFLFEEMNLPTFEKALVPLISFPTKLAQAGLRTRLEYVKKLKDPDLLIVEQTMEDVKLSLGLACTLKRQYEDFLSPSDLGGPWNVPECLAEGYDATIAEALTTFFKLLHMKLKSSKTVYVKETDVLEAQWATLNDVSSAVTGGSCIVAENLCSLVNKLMIRMTNYFDTQVRVPMGEDKSEHTRSTRLVDRGHEEHVMARSRHRKMTPEQVISWYGKMLDSVRLRYRKLQRYARALTQRFSNSAEYSLENVPLDRFIAALVSTEHFLVYTQSMEEEGVYVVAPMSLYDRPDSIRHIINEAYAVDDSEKERAEIIPPDDENEGDDEGEARYLLILSPRNHFLWNGRVMLLNMPKVDLDAKDDRVRLIADGPQRRLAMSKHVFKEIFEPFSEDGQRIESPLKPPPCLIEAQAHSPAVDRELRKIGRSAARLAESVVDSVHIVRSALRSADGYQELMENWYLFASEHGQQAQRYMDRSSLLKFNRLLVKVAISWVSFICDDCEPTDRKTFKWAVNALEFTLHRTKRNILHLPNEQFEMLRAKVATCMTLLINHFDILGAKSLLEAKRDKGKQQGLATDDEDDFSALKDDFSRIDPSTRFFWQRVKCLLLEREEQREINVKVGRVLDDERPEDRSLVFLASSSSSISIRWQQGRFIGAGAFGSVYLAINLDSGTLMAVKEIKFQELTGMPNLYAQIKDELSVMELLHHPNVVEYYGIEVHRDRVYIFEEYCQGGSLAQLLEHGRIEDEGIIQVYTMQMLEGLAYLHSKGIIHRDIKPDNILLDHLGVIKFVDFGAAKILVKNQRSIQRSRRGTERGHSQMPSLNGVGVMSNGLTGTPMYMSPEVIKNDKRGKHGSMDIWSLGCVVLEIATGRKPWSNLDNEWAIMFHIGVATQHPPLPEPSQLSEMGINFIKQCLTIDPLRRPTASELMDHPWMLEFREALLSYEEAELANNPPSHMPSDESYEHASVARQAAIIKEREVERIQCQSPTTPPSPLASPVSDTF